MAPVRLPGRALGIDVGGTGIKAAVVDTRSGRLITDRLKTATPQTGRPEEIVDAVTGLVAELAVDASQLHVGVAVPAVVQHGVTRTAANISKDWIGLDAQRLFSRALGTDVAVVNDADAAGYAEVAYGAARDVPGCVILTTLGTGIGSAIIVNGTLIPNTELGHLDVHDHRNVESWAANSAREREGLSMKAWAQRLQVYYRHLERLFTPDLFVVGGGISRQYADFLPLLDLQTEIVPARLLNSAGILGAAAYVASEEE